MSRTGISLLGLCLAAFAAMAFGASEAQANEWLILNSGGQAKTASELPASLNGELENEEVSLLTELLGAEVKLACSAMTLIGIKLEGGGTITNGGRARFTGCMMYLNGELNEECELHTPGSAVGTMETNAIKGELASHEGATIVKITPKTGSAFFLMQEGEACPLGEEIPIEGELAFKDCENKSGEHLVVHLFEEEPALTNLSALGEPATLDGSALVFLTGEHTGLAWGTEEGEEGGGGEGGKKETPPTWLAKDAGSAGEPLESLKASLAGKAASADVTLLTHLLGLEVEMPCTGAELVGAFLESEGKLTSGSKLKLTGCVLRNGETEEALEECAAKSSGQAAGTVLTGALKGELAKGKEEDLLKVLAKEGTTLATLETGEECLLAEEILISGTLYLRDKEGKLATNEVEHTVLEGSGTELWVGGKTSEHLETSVEGDLALSLTGEHAGHAWGAMVPEAGKASWLVGGPEGSGELLEEFTAALAGKVKGAEVALITHMVGLEVKVACTAGELIGMSLEAKGKLNAGGKAKFSGCKLTNAESGKAIEECVAKSTGEAPGTIVTGALEGELQKSGLVEVEPKEGAVLATLATGEECLLDDEIALSGVVYLKDGEGKLETLQAEHRAEEGTGTELWVGKATAEHLETSLEGGLLVSLAGEYAGLQWSGMKE
jgi:hypothetical protein